MVQRIQAENQENASALRVIESQIREGYGRVVYSHKVHEKTADIYSRRLSTIKLCQIILSAITAGSLLVTLFSQNRIGTIVASFFSTILLGLSTYVKDYDLGELAQKHVETANRLWEIRESCLSLLTDMVSDGLDLEEVRKERDLLQSRLVSVYRNAPRTIDKGYEEARKALKIGEEMTFTDEEIDAFLPAPLRRADNRIRKS